MHNIYTHFNFLVLFLISLSSFSQNLPYTPFDLQNSIWQEEYYALQPYREQYQYIPAGDTIIQGISFTKIQKSGRYTFNYQEADQSSWFPINEYAGAIRENESRQIIFVKPGSEQEGVLYDFDLALGDTIDLFQDGLKGKVIAIDSIEICSTFRNRYEIELIDQYILRPLYWIDGYGSNHGLLQRYEIFEDGTLEGAGCFSATGCEACDIISDIDKEVQNETGIRLSQAAPGADIEIEWKVPGRDATIKIMDLNGRIIYQSNERTDLISLSSFNFSAGIYILQIESGKNQLAKKFTLE